LSTENDLAKARLITQMIRQHNTSIQELLEKRRALSLKMRENGVTYATMAQALEVSETMVFKILAGDEGRVPPKLA